MSLIQLRQSRLMLTLIVFISINFGYSQVVISNFRPSNVEIVPSVVVIDSTSSTNFICVDHESHHKPLTVNLSKIIPPSEMKITTNQLNKTAINIQLEMKNYVGIFHLLCYNDGEKSKGTRADIIVKASPGVFQLAERCRVYDRQYIKCLIRAPTIARAIQNDYPPKFEFHEISQPPDHTTYISRVEFLKNESTSEHLVFKWKPTVDGEFPDRVQMHMKAMLPHFDESSYYFDMTPIFRITPKFTVQSESSTGIRINVTPTDPPALCEKSILPKLSMALNYTWTLIDSNRNTILDDNLLSDSTYRVCMKCRQTYSDPDGNPVCQEITTLSKLSVLSDRYYLIFITIILILILFIIFGLGFHFWQSRKKPRDEHVVTQQKHTMGPLNSYVLAPPNPIPNTPRRKKDSESLLNSDDTDSYNEDPVIGNSNDQYIHIASIEDFSEMSSPPKILFPCENEFILSKNCTIQNSEIFIINAETDLSLLTTNQIQTWLRAVSQINSSTQEPHINIIRGGDEVEIPLYRYGNHVIPQHRYLFKQNINKRVDCYLYENEFNSLTSFDFYDTCHGTLSLKQARRELAGIYVYAGNETSLGLGIIHVETTNSFQWFNGTNFYSFDNQTNLKHGTQLVLGFETMLYYNANSDLTRYNTKINDIIQQANISIENHTSNNLEMFMSMEDLSCQRHQRIIHEDLRSLIFACTIKVTFKCSLQVGSTCWIENKHISNIRLNINSFTFITDRKLSMRIDA
ncbi:unnamed protein product [Rotaria socialis]|uniref:Uncharacterized protein n=1 Tax=Rotaria socialis TaxID=392032 RepID=A0A821FFF5_9BILA|nr:unnamed protein product [Rotaria socialis]